ncbi:MAG: hypothetical protein AB7D57_00970 [Desulfovibrionaceae bacterium]
MRVPGQDGRGADGRDSGRWPSRSGSPFQRQLAFRARWSLGDELLARATHREGALTWVEADGLPLLTELPPGTPLGVPLRFAVAALQPEIVLRYLGGGGGDPSGRPVRDAMQAFVAARAAFEAEAGPLLRGLDAPAPAARRTQLAAALAAAPEQAARHARVLAAAADCNTLVAERELRLDYPVWLLPEARTLERLHRPTGVGDLLETSLYAELEPFGALLAVRLERPGRAALRLKVEHGAGRLTPAGTFPAAIPAGAVPAGAVPTSALSELLANLRVGLGLAAEAPDPAAETNETPGPRAELLGVEPLPRTAHGGLLPRLILG